MPRFFFDQQMSDQTICDEDGQVLADIRAAKQRAFELIGTMIAVNADCDPSGLITVDVRDGKNVVFSASATLESAAPVASGAEDAAHNDNADSQLLLGEEINSLSLRPVVHEIDRGETSKYWAQNEYSEQMKKLNLDVLEAALRKLN